MMLSAPGAPLLLMATLLPAWDLFLHHLPRLLHISVNLGDLAVLVAALRTAVLPPAYS